MMNWFKKILPREDKFFDMFERHSMVLVAGADAMQKMLHGGDHVAHFARVIVELEQDADEIAREVMLAVRRTFITPFDRIDIKDLIQSMDDAIDQMHQTAKTISLFEVRQFNPFMQNMATLTVEAAGLTAKTIPLLREIAAHAGEINAYAEHVTRLEEKADVLHDDGLRDLFHSHGKSDPMAFIIGSQLYGHLENVVDRFEDVANEINGIVIEHI